MSKLIDPWARALCNQESVDSAVEAGRWDRALGLMRVWLREAGLEERATARSSIERALEHAPPAELVALLDRTSGAAATPAEEDEAMRRLVAQRLALVARQRKDAPLAQHLLATAGELLGDQGDPVAQLAAGANRARVEARTVGLLLSLRNDRTRRRGADIAEGVSFGLELPGSAARLVSRDDHGSPERLEEALAALSADGASIIIAGSDEQEATQAAAFAEAHHIPVLLLRPPAVEPGGAQARFSFVVGAEPADLEASLIAALVTRGAAPVAILADEPARPRAPRPDVVGLRGCNEASSPWKGLGAAGVVLSAEHACARDAIAAAAPLKLRFAGGFEAAALALPAGSVIAAAGVFPFGPTPPPRVEAWLRTHPGPPSWWAALGHDAAVLAWAGVQVLPAQGTEEPGEVEARRAQAAAALAAAQADLWTTEARGFHGARTLPRTLGVRENHGSWQALRGRRGVGTLLSRAMDSPRRARRARTWEDALSTIDGLRPRRRDPPGRPRGLGRPRRAAPVPRRRGSRRSHHARRRSRQEPRRPRPHPGPGDRALRRDEGARHATAWRTRRRSTAPWARPRTPTGCWSAASSRP